MDKTSRRAYLALGATGATIGLSGCLSWFQGDDEPSTVDRDELTGENNEDEYDHWDDELEGHDSPQPDRESPPDVTVEITVFDQNGLGANVRATEWKNTEYLVVLVNDDEVDEIESIGEYVGLEHIEEGDVITVEAINGDHRELVEAETVQQP